MSKREPLLTIAGVTAGVTATITLLVSFGVNVTDEQQIAILSIVAVGAPVLVAVVGRTKVYSPATVAELEEAAAEPALATTVTTGLMAVPPDEDLLDLFDDDDLDSLDEYDLSTVTDGDESSDEVDVTVVDDYDDYDEDDEDNPVYEMRLDGPGEDLGPLFHDHDLISAETPRNDEGNINV